MIEGLFEQIQIDEVLLAVIVVAVFLIVLTILFILTIRRVNVLTKKDFMDKLQEYDALVDEREAKVQELNQMIEQRKSDNDLLLEKAEELARGHEKEGKTGALVFPRYANLVSDNILGQYKRIKENFNFNIVNLVRKFISDHPEDKEKTRLYRVYYKVRRDLSFEVVFKLSTYQSEEQRYIIKQLFASELDDLSAMVDKDSFDAIEMAKELDDLLTVYDPRVFVLVSNQNENYDYLNQRVVTKYDPSITEGFKISYQGSVTDFSI